MTTHPALRQIPAVAALLDTADVIDLKHVDAPLDLRTFIAGMFVLPGWVLFLFRVRNLFARLIGIEADAIPQPHVLRPEDVAMTPGEHTMFTVKEAVEDHYWIAGESESHLDFDLAVVVEPLDGGVNRICVLTVVRYNRWVGRLYFAVIAPFHHLIVGQLMRASVRRAAA